MFVANIISDVRDYKKGALGNVRKLGCAYLTYLRIASSELQEWEGETLKEKSKEIKDKK